MFPKFGMNELQTKARRTQPTDCEDRDADTKGASGDTTGPIGLSRPRDDNAISEIRKRLF